MPLVDSAIYLEITRKGIPMLFLHHSICSFQEWEGFREIVGGKYIMPNFEPDSKLHSDFKHDIVLEVEVVDSHHPVNEGINDFAIHDEGYSNIQINEGIHPLLSTRHPDCAPLVGWVNQAGNSTSVYLMMGHDKHAYENESFRKLIRNAIHWLSDQ
jgi:type 1 glutamine amidotransferase